MPYEAESFTRLSVEAGRTPPANPSDRRSVFAHDRDRILYSTAFRRMAGKTQVVATQEFGLYHTRLTHSLKVAQLGRRLAERLGQRFLMQHPEFPSSEIVPPDPDLVEAACLAHDMGHPPFGHRGEYTLSQAFDNIAFAAARSRWLPAVATDQRARTRGGFEGNAQTFRILTYLSARAPLSPRCGLDLSRAAVDASIKYPCFRVTGLHVAEKWGAIDLDTQRFRWVREGVGVGIRARQSFETQLMDWCDDVTYAVHDVTDFFRGGALPLHRLTAFRGRPGGREFSDEAREFLEAVARRNPEWDEALSREAWARICNLAEIFEAWRPTLEVKAATQAVTSQMISFLVDDVGWDGDCPARHQADFVIDSSDDMVRLKTRACDLLKQALWIYVIDTPAMATQQRGHERIVRDLLAAHHGSPELLPDDRLQDLTDHGDELRAATDHIASLTEADAQALHLRILGVSLGSITDAFERGNR